MERCGVLDLAIIQTAWEVGNAVSDGVPHAIALIGGTVSWRIDRNAPLDEGVEVDHVEMVLEEGDGLGAADGRWERGYGGEGGALRHGCGAESQTR